MTVTGKTFAQYQTEAKKEPFLLPLGDGEEPIVVQQPSLKAVRKLNEAKQRGDEDAAVRALFGEQQGKLLLALCEDEAAEVLNAITGDVLKHFGMLPVGDS